MEERSITHSRPMLGEADRVDIEAVLNSGMLERGARVEAVEAWFRDAFGARAAIATGSGSQALLLALRSLGVGQGDEVILPSYVCPEVMGPIHLLGANAVLVDSADDFLPVTQSIARAVSPRTRAIVFPYLFGIHRAIDDVVALGLPVIEDCAHFLAPGVPGGGIVGDLAFFSFKATKLVAGGEGGLVLTRSDARARALRAASACALPGVVSSLYAFSDLSAALVASQLRRYAEFANDRQRIARAYVAACDQLPGIEVGAAARRAPVPFRLPLRVESAARADALIAALARRRIVARRPVEPTCHQCLGLAGFPGASALHASTVSLPLYPALDPDAVAGVISALREAWDEVR
ncbi:MAG: DegT/DnrJ/EryC1/StrS family aminotransferase [Gammaproteobacteria bacterium]|nr:DegT/DnrJ/EryC1/StrS family aminotransferase [Gammaproteobacteria bacterium]